MLKPSCVVVTLNYWGFIFYTQNILTLKWLSTKLKPNFMVGFDSITEKAYYQTVSKLL